MKLDFDQIDYSTAYAALPNLWMGYRVKLNSERRKVLRAEFLGNKNELVSVFDTWGEAFEAAQDDFNRRLERAS